MVTSAMFISADGRVDAAASRGLILQRVDQPDPAVERALGRSPASLLLTALSVASGDRAGTVHVTVRAAADRIAVVYGVTGSGSLRPLDPTKASAGELRFNLALVEQQSIRLFVIEAVSSRERALVLRDLTVKVDGGGLGRRERFLRPLDEQPVGAELDEFDVTGPDPSEGPTALLAPAEAPPSRDWREFAQIGASMPPLVQLGTTVAVTVRLARGQVSVDPGQSHDEQVIIVDPAQTVNVALFCRNFAVPPDETDSRDVLLPPPDEELVVTFTVVAAGIGDGDVQVVVRQVEPMPLATLWLSSTVQPDPVPLNPDGADADPTTAFIASGVRQFLAPKTLTIDENLVGAQSRLSFELVLPGIRRSFELVIADKPKLIGALFGAIDAAWTDFKGLQTARERNLAFRGRLQVLGVQLAKDVLPAELRSFFQEHPEQIDELTILTSGETDIPWELVYITDPDIDDDGKDESGFLGRAGLVRWIYNTPHPLELKVAAGRARYLCPRYIDGELALIDAERDLDYLVSDFAATELTPGDPDSIRTLLTNGAIDLLHFGGHGLTDEAADPPRQQLLLANFIRSATESPDAYSLDDLRRDLPNRPPLAFHDPGPLVVLNACRLGRPPSKHSEHGGFAEAFLRGGAAAFVGCLWSVGDEPARDFVRAFYAGLRAHKTIAKATIDARLEARKSGDSSWLAYTVYAHPDARLELVGIEPPAAASSASAASSPTLDALPLPPKGTPVSDSIETRSTPRGSGLSAAELQALHPHVVNLKNGELAKGPSRRPTGDDDFLTTPADLSEIFRTHLPAFIANQARPGPVPLVIYAHGGLVNKGSGLKIAQQQVKWWRKNGAYPIHVVWETGLAASLLDAVKDSLPGRPRNLGDFFDGIIETAVRSARGDLTWTAMKRDAEHAAGATGGATALATQISAYMRANPGQISVHLIGHSAGSILHSHLIPVLFAAGVPRITSLSLLAPAVRVDTFKKYVVPALGKIDALTMYTMSNEFEENDTCLGIYQKSLLYLIRGALESEPGARILGLDICMTADPELSDLFRAPGSGSSVEVVWSKSDSGPRSSSQSKTHGGFDNDPATMNSVARRVLDRELIVPFSATRAVDPIWPSGDEVFDYIEQAENNTAAFSSAAPANGQRPPRRRALCIGIDSYPLDPLFGCVADALAWQAEFAAAGFETESLLNEQATQVRMLDSIRELVTSSRAGDVIVLQYSGHGTTVDDLDQDEMLEDAGDTAEGGDVEHRLVDEALCPVDFQEGNLIIDDDLGDIWDLLPDDVNLTIFFDSCHSGGGQRDTDGHAQSLPGSRKRLARMTPGAVEAYKTKRGSIPRSTSRDNERGVFFGACLATEVAYETGSQGDFTSRALPLLREAIGLATNSGFHDSVLSAFGDPRRQTPVVKPPALLGRTLLAPVTTESAAGPAAIAEAAVAAESRPLVPPQKSAPLTLEEGTGDRSTAVAAFLRATAELIAPR